MAYSAQDTIKTAKVALKHNKSIISKLDKLLQQTTGLEQEFNDWEIAALLLEWALDAMSESKFRKMFANYVNQSENGMLDSKSELDKLRDLLDS